MNFEDLKFMSIGSNCVFLACFDRKARLKGPVDNVSLKGVNALKLLFENKFYSFIYNTTPVKRHKNSNEFKKGDCEYETTYPNNTVSFIHNIPEGEHFFNNLKTRCDALMAFLPEVKTNPNAWLIFTLNGNFVKYGMGTLVLDNLKNCLLYLKDINILHKVIIIGSKVKDSDYKVFNHYLNNDSLNKLSVDIKEPINYLELTDVNAWEPAETQKQFKLKIVPAINTYLNRT